jgi:hypothetical protein
VPAGTTIAEIEDTSELRARVFVAEPFFHYLHAGMPVVIHLDQSLTTVHGRVQAILPAAADNPPEGAITKSSYKGMQLPTFYPVLVSIANAGELRTGMVGTAKLMVRRRSIAGFCWQGIHHFFARRIW